MLQFWIQRSVPYSFGYSYRANVSSYIVYIFFDTILFFMIRSMGMDQEADKIEQQQKASKAGAAGQQPSQHPQCDYCPFSNFRITRMF